jgi:hypothetical protein
MQTICAKERFYRYMATMGILLTIAGIIVLLYTLSSVMGLWLSYKVMDAVADDAPLPEALEEVPDHHIELMANFAHGWRRYAWAGSIIALFTTLIALVTSSPLAFWALGSALLIDSLLFLTYDGLKQFVAQTNLQERLIDIAQCLALLAAFALLLWINLRIGDVIQ